MVVIMIVEQEERLRPENQMPKPKYGDPRDYREVEEEEELTT